MEGQNYSPNIVSPKQKNGVKKMSSVILQFSKVAAADKELATELSLKLQEGVESLSEWLAEQGFLIDEEERRFIRKHKLDPDTRKVQAELTPY